MMVRSAVPGEAGELIFSGSEEMLQALGMLIAREAEENRYNLDVHDLDQPGAQNNSVQVSGNTAPGVLPGATLKLDSVLGIDIAEFERCAQEFRHLAEQEESVYVRLVDRGKVLQIGANPGQTARLDLGDVSSNALGLDAESLKNHETATRALGRIDSAIAQVSRQRGLLGAVENRLEHSTSNLMVAAENLSSAESRIRDADIAREFLNYVREQVMFQVGTNLMAQANMQRGTVLNLIE